MGNKRCKRVIVILVAVLLVIYIVMLLTTNGLMHRVKDAVYGVGEAPQNPYSKIYDYFDGARGYDNIKVKDFAMHRLFVIHGFNHGYMWVLYSYEVYSDEGEIIRGCRNILSRWEIQKIDGQWDIVAVKQRP